MAARARPLDDKAEARVMRVLTLVAQLHGRNPSGGHGGHDYSAQQVHKDE